MFENISIKPYIIESKIKTVEPIENVKSEEFIDNIRQVKSEFKENADVESALNKMANASKEPQDS